MIQPRTNLVRVLVPARQALASHWRSALLLLGVAAAAIGAGSAIDALGDGAVPQAARLGPAPSPSPAMDVEWTPDAETPSALRARTTAELLGLLSLTSWGVVAVAGVGLLCIGGGRAARRRAEVQTRRALGASRRTLVLSFLAEGTALIVLAGGAGVVLGAIGAYQAASSWPGQAASWRWTSGAILAALALVLLLGALLPALYLRPREVRELPPLYPPRALAAIQLAVALSILVAGARVIGRAGIMLTPPTTVAATGSVYRLDLRGHAPADRGRQYATLLTGFAADSDLALASLASPGALLGVGVVDYLRTDCGNCYVGGIYLKWRVLRATYHSASADTFVARGAPITEGRTFTAADTAGATPVAIVNRHLAARYFEGGRPLGRSIWLGGRMSGRAYRVVGVVDDGRPAGFGAGGLPFEAVYLSSLQHPPEDAELLLRPRRPGAGTGAVGTMATVLGAVPAPLPEPDFRRADAAPITWFGRWFRFEGRVTLLLATAGVLGLMHLWVNARRAEFALRRALGAPKSRILATVAGHAALTALQGIALAVLFVGPFLWGELDRIIPGLPSLPLAAAIGFGAVLGLATAAGTLIPALQGLARPPAGDLHL